MQILPFILALAASNTFMTVAWYAHLRDLNDKPWYIAAIISWGIALFEYLIQVPANRYGFQFMTLAQLKITQEIISLAVFIPFAVLYMKNKITWNYLAACGCLILAAILIFQENQP
ncbi:MAG: hypothetical protein D6694_14370 [Gammaproteobacteria bacterium]|nr:MAG: hypothetical protein D6694_14370 [Gammaproteobacteria bacterium]